MDLLPPTLISYNSTKHKNILDFVNLMTYNKRMGTNITPITPEYIPISPESLEIANTYLQCQDVSETAKLLGLPLDQVAAYLAKPDVKEYVTAVYLDSGYRNRFKLGKILDEVIDKKLIEMQEADIGSSKDILDILAMVHKMRMDELAAITALEKARSAGPKKQTNIQINNPAGSIFEKLMDNDEL
jgi:hypothetical protein